MTKSSNYTKFQEPAFIYRLRQGISATEVELNVRGRIDQPNLRRGATDPLKFIMAFSDINAIAMEGTEQMIKDATNLCFERNKAPSVDEYKEFLAKQPDFLRSRLNDVRIKTDIARYFPDTEEEVFGKLWDNFHENIVAANDFACRLTGVPGLNQILRRIIKANPFNAGKFAVRELKKFS